ncbi:MAG: fluoride efflux transporter CrcB [Hyphomicrobiales bacterium]|nr:MAG: fluoride efflux transporter CrcB [Hyphomicrobiales bacterium]
MNPLYLASVAAGGAVGASMRYMVSLAGIGLFGPGFPWWTLFVNVTGSFAMGAVFEFIAGRYHIPNPAQLFLLTGIMGGFTTFSAFSLEVVTMLESRDYWAALSYAAASVLLSILALFAGLYLMRANLT